MKAKYVIDPSHSTAGFSVKHMMISKVHGGFEKLSGEFVLDSENPSESYVTASIDVASISTRDAQRDAHLKSADFFDIEKFPLISFRSTQIEKKGNGMNIVGDLTIHGITKQVSLEVEGPTAELKDPWGNIKIGVSGTTKINRKDFGLTWNAALETGGILVGEEVNITLEVQFVKRS